MKVKTSITLSEDVLHQVDKYADGRQSRSEFIETAVRSFISHLRKKRREARDLAIINRRATSLNREAEDVLGFQVEI